MKKKVLYSLLVIIIVGVALAAYGYSIINTGLDIKKTTYIYIDERKDYDILLKELKDSAKVSNLSNFERLASSGKSMGGRTYQERRSARFANQNRKET